MAACAPRAAPRAGPPRRASRAAPSARRRPPRATSDGADADAVPPSLPVAGADTDWREFRARLVAASGGPSAPPPPAPPPGGRPTAAGTARGWAHALAAPEPGAVLVAHPALFTAGQTYFHQVGGGGGGGGGRERGSRRPRRPPAPLQAVILLIAHDPSTAPGAGGSAGLILNKATQFALGEVRGADALLPTFAASTLHLGGDVERASMHVLHNVPSVPGSVEVVPGLRVGGVDGAVAAVAAGGAAPDGFQWFSGYCGWAPGQLAAEVDAGVWFVAAADAATLKSASRPGGPKGAALWHALLDAMGGEHAALAAAVRGGVDDRIMRLVREDDGDDGASDGESGGEGEEGP
jgi:putative transcriptional regulator